MLVRMSDVERFLASSSFAVVGASDDRAKYGNKVLRCYQQAGRDVVPVHPRLTEVEGLPAAASLSALDEVPEAVSIITPPPGGCGPGPVLPVVCVCGSVWAFPLLSWCQWAPPEGLPPV